MKPYFGKQVIERPRRGSHFKSLKVRCFGCINDDGEYEGSNRIPMSRHAVDKYNKKLESKDFTDLLGPVTRYLFGKVGARWDDVFSELSQAFGAASYPIQHILHSHILNRQQLGPDNNSPLDYHAQGGDFFVDEAGIVQYFHWRAHRHKKKSKPVRAVQDGERWFVEIKGLWFIGRYRRTRSRIGDDGRYISSEWPNRKEGWGGNAVIHRFIKIKQANRRELKWLALLKEKL